MNWKTAAAAVLLLSLAAEPALGEAVAQDSAAAIQVPWGSWVQQLIDIAGEAMVLVVGGVFAFVVAQLGPIAGATMMTFRVDQLLEQGVRAALAKGRGAAEGRELTLEVQSEILLYAYSYVLAHGAPTVIRFLGDALPMLVEKLLARMQKLGVVGAEFDLDRAIAAVRNGPRSREEALHEMEARYGHWQKLAA